MPADRLKVVTYIKFVCNIRTKKKDPYRTRATMGGNLINYSEDVGTPTANLLLIKNLLEQSYIGARSQVCRRRSYQFLPYDSIEKARIHKDEIVIYT